MADRLLQESNSLLLQEDDFAILLDPVVLTRAHGAPFLPPDGSTMGVGSDYPSTLTVVSDGIHPSGCKLQWRVDGTGGWTDVTTRNLQGLFEYTISASDYADGIHLLNQQIVPTSGTTLSLNDVQFRVADGLLKVNATASGGGEGLNTVLAANAASINHLQITLAVADFNFADRPGTDDTDDGFVTVIGANQTGSIFVNEGAGYGFKTNHVWLENLTIGDGTNGLVIPAGGGGTTSFCDNVVMVFKDVIIEQDGRDTSNFLVRDYSGSEFLKMTYFNGVRIVLAAGPMNGTVMNTISEGGAVVYQNIGGLVDSTARYVYKVWPAAHADVYLGNGDGNLVSTSRIVRGLTAVDPSFPHPTLDTDITLIEGRGVNLVGPALVAGVQLAVVDTIVIPGTAFQSNISASGDAGNVTNCYLKQSVLPKLAFSGDGTVEVLIEDCVRGFTANQRVESNGYPEAFTNIIICPWIANASTMYFYHPQPTPVTSGIVPSKWKVKTRAGTVIGTISNVEYISGVDFAGQITMTAPVLPTTADFQTADIVLDIEAAGFVSSTGSANTAQTTGVRMWRNFSAGAVPTIGPIRSTGDAYLVLGMI